MPKEPKRMTRVQFDFSPKAIRRLDELVTVTDAASRAEVVRHALQWYDWLVRTRDEGHEFCVRSKEGEVVRILFVAL